MPSSAVGWPPRRGVGPTFPSQRGSRFLSPLAIELGHAATFADLCRERGLPVDASRPSRLGYLDRTPPSLYLVPPTYPALHVRPADGAAIGETPPPSDNGAIMVTMGSVFPARYRAFLTRFAAACQVLPSPVTIVTGTFAPEDLGAVPDNVTVLRWVDLDEHLARASVVVSHGGRGTTIAALARGIPQVMMPYSADQPAWATACAARGVAINLATAPLAGGLFPAIDPDAADPRDLVAAIEVANGDTAMRAAAGEVAREIRSMPPVGDAVDRLVARV